MEFKNFYDIVNQMSLTNWPNEVKFMLLFADEMADNKEKIDFFKWFKNESFEKLNSLDVSSKPEDHFSCFEGWTWDMFTPEIQCEIKNEKNLLFFIFDNGNNIFTSNKYKLPYWDVCVDVYECNGSIYIILPTTEITNGYCALKNIILKIKKDNYSKYKEWIHFTSNRGELSFEDGYLCNSSISY